MTFTSILWYKVRAFGTKVLHLHIQCYSTVTACRAIRFARWLKKFTEADCLNSHAKCLSRVDSMLGIVVARLFGFNQSCCDVVVTMFYLIWFTVWVYYNEYMVKHHFDPHQTWPNSATLLLLLLLLLQRCLYIHIQIDKWMFMYNSKIFIRRKFGKCLLIASKRFNLSRCYQLDNFY